MIDRPRSVLIVEDEPVIAMDIAIAFTDAGWSVIGPAGTLEQAEQMVKSARPSAAVMDIDMHGQSSVPLAERLARKKVRVVFFTGDWPHGLPPALADVTIVSKPADVEEVIARCSDPES
jgi:DNA-binding response OmpR family regulator